MIPAVKKLTSPDAAGSAEYRALHELLEDATTLEEAVGICEEMRSWASAAATTLNQSKLP